MLFLCNRNTINCSQLLGLTLVMMLQICEGNDPDYAMVHLLTLSSANQQILKCVLRGQNPFLTLMVFLFKFQYMLVFAESQKTMTETSLFFLWLNCQKIVIFEEIFKHILCLKQSRAGGQKALLCKLQYDSSLLVQTSQVPKTVCAYKTSWSQPATSTEVLQDTHST